MITRDDIITARNALAPGETVFRLGNHHVGVVVDDDTEAGNPLMVAIQPVGGERYVFLQHQADKAPTMDADLDFAGLLAAEQQLRAFEEQERSALEARASELAADKELQQEREAVIAAKTITLTRQLDPATNAYPGASDLLALVKEQFPNKRFTIRADGENVKVTIFDEDTLEPVEIEPAARAVLATDLLSLKPGGQK